MWTSPHAGRWRARGRIREARDAWRNGEQRSDPCDSSPTERVKRATLGAIKGGLTMAKMTIDDYLEWLDAWVSGDPYRWAELRHACLQYWLDCPEFRDFVEAMIDQDRPEEVLCWVSEHM